MTSVPHTPHPASRSPRSSPSSSATSPPPHRRSRRATRTTETHWQDAVTQVGEQLRAKLRVEVLPDRLHKALALVLAHAVTLHPDGTASVQSGKQTYRLAPDCPCADATHRAELCKHTLAVELHRRTLALLDSAAPASSPTAAGAEATTGPALHTSAEAPPAAAPPATEDTRQEQLPSADRWHVNEAPASCCLRLRIGEIELMYTMRDVSDAELTSRVQHLVPWVQDVLDQARERQAHLDLLRQQREATSAGQAAVPQPPSPTPPADLQALIQQAVQQALAAQQPASTGQTPRQRPAPAAHAAPRARQTGARCIRWPWSSAAMPRARGTATGWPANSATARAKCNGAPRRPNHPAGQDPAPREEEHMTRGTPGIQVGSLAIATRASGVCDAGERGVCYEVYTLGDVQDTASSLTRAVTTAFVRRMWRCS